ncbi:hypothetical protein E5843_13965 [Luteimonas yindakuii]|nr:hypothetical protein E5843_13965 [Luteimonas yindakuii]
MKRIQHDRVRPQWLAAATMTALALAMPGVASAQTAKERELEARIAQLESQVQALLSQQQQTATQVQEVRTAQAAQPARPAVPAGAQPIQATTITPQANPGTVFTVGGMIRMDAMATKTTDGDIAKGSAGRDFYVPGAIPVGGNGPETYSDAHLKFSRLWLDASTTLDSGDRLAARLELDFFGGSLGNTAATNTYGATLRHAYVSWNNWLAGQTWSNFMDTAALIDAVDFVGPTDAVVFVRQPQLRYTNGPWAVSLESPETTVQPLNGAPRVIGGDNSAMPDVIARYTHKADWGHFSVAGMARQLKYEPVAGADSTDTGYGATVSGLVKMGDATDLRYQLTGGDGIGRYIGLATIQQDAMLDTSGDIDALGGWAGYVGLRHVFNPRVRGNLYHARSQWGNEIAWTGTGVTSKVQSWHANLIWTPYPKLDLGVEAIWGERTLESGVDGELIRLHTMARYSF